MYLAHAEWLMSHDPHDHQKPLCTQEWQFPLNLILEMRLEFLHVHANLFASITFFPLPRGYFTSIATSESMFPSEWTSNGMIWSRLSL